MEKLLAWVHNELDRGIHALSWEVLTKPKRVGGANNKVAKRMNWAILAKLAWRVLNSQEEKWCETLKSKYGVGEKDGGHFRLTQRSSQVWRGLIWGEALLRQGLKWKYTIDNAHTFGKMYGWARSAYARRKMLN